MILRMPFEFYGEGAKGDTVAEGAMVRGIVCLM